MIDEKLNLEYKNYRVFEFYTKNNIEVFLSSIDTFCLNDKNKYFNLKNKMVYIVDVIDCKNYIEISSKIYLKKRIAKKSYKKLIENLQNNFEVEGIF